MSVLEQIAAVSNVLMTLAVTVFAVVGVVVVWRFRHAYQKLNALIERTKREVDPLLQNAKSISDNINSISTTIRNDVKMVNDTITSANERVREAVLQAEDRLHEFNALLAVVQEEAEDVFVSTAATVRGVRSGAEAFRARGRRRGMDLASDELDAGEMARAIDDSMEGEEEGDGDHGNSRHAGHTEPSAEALSAAPRLSPRTRSQRRRGA